MCKNDNNNNIMIIVIATASDRVILWFELLGSVAIVNLN
jgi:hypothetical protein